MGTTAAFEKDAAGLLSILWASSLRAQAQLGAATSTAPVDKRLESSRTKTTDELDALEESTVVRIAVCSKPTPDGLIDA
jgi:hypothetical protein